MLRVLLLLFLKIRTVLRVMISPPFAASKSSIRIADEYGQYAVDMCQIRVLCGGYSTHTAFQSPQRLHGLRRRYLKDVPYRDTAVSAVLGEGVYDGLAGANGKDAGWRIVEQEHI